MTNNYKEKFIEHLEDSISGNRLIKVVLGKYKGDEPDLQRIVIKQIAVKEETKLSFVYCYKTKEITKNFKIVEGIEKIAALVESPFMSGNLFSTTENIQIIYSRKGKCSWSCKRVYNEVVTSQQHDHQKERYVDQNKAFLTALGVTNENHQVLPSMSKKWKQINKFLEIFKHAYNSSRLVDAKKVSVADFGSGKGYLTFAIHDLLRDSFGVDAQVTGIELRDNLVNFCNDVASKLNMDSLKFFQGDVNSYNPENLQVMIALHACDTATDQAIFLGIRCESEIIMCAPCCHKEIRKQICSPEIIEPILKHGIHLGQEAEMVTDGLRALLLEAYGYKTQIIEFISLEHTGKNKMILAVKHDQPVDREAVMAKVTKVKEFYGIKTQCLEELLAKWLRH
ncbi:MAG: SAM-dependent methyltransferase [Kiritimatiellae bacterium]|jgi:16S rRNA G527 N7-methylase RsmG|nr:SAM-dependent methyltransferase [Kiritimatiellia bacterium]